MRYRSEPPYAHGTPARTAVLLVNLGTPDDPTKGAVRRYLKEFLSDPRVVEIPRALWMPLLNGVVLNTRPAKSAAKYAQIWTSEGSPLRVHTTRQCTLLQGYLGQTDGRNITFEYAMRYGGPSIESVIWKLKEANCERILVVPLYPQYSASTTASAFDEVTRCLRAARNVPELRFVRHFHDHPMYIRALAGSVRGHWQRNGRGERLVMSFHGVPRFTLERGDPYHCECQKTARLLAEELGVDADQWLITFQSRFGRAEWLKPYTQPTLEQLARRGVATVDIVCPGFVADCLETLEEIAIECKAAFLGAGGREFHYIPCLNENHDWISALASIVTFHLSGWLDQVGSGASASGLSAARARALGAAR